MTATPASGPNSSPLLTLIGLGQKARQAGSLDELGFLLVNDSRSLGEYRQALLWRAARGVTHLSGVLVPERHSPFVLWAQRLCEHLAAQPALAGKTLGAEDLPEPLRAGWAQWLPTQAWWLPFDGPGPAGLLVADEQLDAQRLPLWQEWLAVWGHAADRLWRSDAASPLAWLRGWFAGGAAAARPWYRARWPWVAAALALVLAVPVPLTVVGQGEVVPRDAVLVRAPLDGVIKEFHVTPNQRVEAGTPLFSYDNELVRSRLQVARQALLAAQAEYRQSAQSALTDARAKFQLAALVGKVQEKQAEVAFLAEQVQRTTVSAPQPGVVLFDDTTQWVGKPVQTGERVVRVADPADTELEVWIALADAVPLQSNDAVKLFLAASPLDALSAQVRWVGYEAQPRPDGSWAYRVRARLLEPAAARIGAKGTARVTAGRVALGYWLLRKPWAALRGYLLI